MNEAEEREIMLLLTQLKEAENIDIRAGAAEQLGRKTLLLDKIVPALKEALNDENWLVRVKVAQALGMLGKVALPALEALREAMKEPRNKAKRGAFYEVVQKLENLQITLEEVGEVEQQPSTVVKEEAAPSQPIKPAEEEKGEEEEKAQEQKEELEKPEPTPAEVEKVAEEKVSPPSEVTAPVQEKPPEEPPTEETAKEEEAEPAKSEDEAEVIEEAVEDAVEDAIEDAIEEVTDQPVEEDVVEKVAEEIAEEVVEIQEPSVEGQQPEQLEPEEKGEEEEKQAPPKEAEKKEEEKTTIEKEQPEIEPTETKEGATTPTETAKTTTTTIQEEMISEKQPVIKTVEEKALEEIKEPVPLDEVLEFEDETKTDAEKKKTILTLPEELPEQELPAKKYEQIIVKIILLGDKAVGKSSLRTKYCDKQRKDEFRETLGADFVSKHLEKEGKHYAIQVWDLAPGRKIDDLRETFYKGTKGAVLVFDVTDQATLTNCKNWLKEVKEQEPESSFILIGNKIDKRIAGEEGQVTTEEGNAFAQELSLEAGRTVPYVEVSASTGEQVEHAFELLLSQILETN